MNKLILFALITSCFGCSIDRTFVEVSEVEKNVLLNFQKIPSESKLKIADENEPGEKLLLCLTFRDKENKQGLSNQLVKFYHTSIDGNYEPTDPNDESTARLSGQATTNLKGQIYIETILPGDYGSSGDNRHIHTNVVGARPYAYDIHFRQYAGNMLRRFIKGSNQHFLADLKKTKENKLVGFLTIEVKNPTSSNK